MIAALLAATVLTGCTGPRQLAPVLHAPLRAQNQPIPPDGRIVVRGGDSIYSIAGRYGVPPTQIIRHNGIKPPYVIHRGQILFLPQISVHTVIGGDTLYSISKRYGVGQYQLARVNGLREPFELHVGQRLALPAKLDFSALDRAPDRAPAGPGDSETRTARAPDVPTPTSKPAGGSRGGDRAAGGEAGGGGLLPTSKPAPLLPTPKPTQRRSIAAPSAPGRFRWPVEGRIIAEFGPATRGVHNDGVNITAPAGTPVRASARGRVAFVGRGVKSFGTLILIKHEGGIITAYAHLDKVHVRVGDLIDGGQQIATVGQSGKVQRPQLHFEIRKAREPVDPRQVIS